MIKKYFILEVSNRKVAFSAFLLFDNNMFDSSRVFSRRKFSLPSENNRRDLLPAKIDCILLYVFCLLSLIFSYFLLFSLIYSYFLLFSLIFFLFSLIFTLFSLVSLNFPLIQFF